MPARLHGQPAHEKHANPDDLIVMVGGRIGKDGIHGATFSSQELGEDSPVSAVQIGDPITQKKMFDFLLEARDQGLYSAITDNGAGGLSSSVGEMARHCKGCELHLDKAPLKYAGLQPWEILLTEACAHQWPRTRHSLGPLLRWFRISGRRCTLGLGVQGRGRGAHVDPESRDRQDHRTNAEDAKNLVEAAPKMVKEGVAKAEAEDMKKKLTDAGATVTLK